MDFVCVVNQTVGLQIQTLKKQIKKQNQMNITPRIKSARNRNNLIVNVSIEIPLKQKIGISHRSQQTSISPSPNRNKKKYKLISSSANQKKSMNSSNINTLREVPYISVEHPPSRKKYSNPTPSTNINQSIKGHIHKLKSCELSPKKKGHINRKAKQSLKITRNISILEQAVNQDDNIIKYTTNSNELKQKSEDYILIQNLARKMDTHISEIDIAQIRKIQNSAKDKKEKQYLTKMYEFLRTASAKKIQRAWRNYKTKKLIRSYSNDIRNKYLRNINISEQPILTVRSQGMGLKFKKKLADYQEITAREIEEASQISDRSDKNTKIVQKIQEDNLQKWEGFLDQIKNKKNVNAALQFSQKRSDQLKKQLDKEFLQKSQQSQSSFQGKLSSDTRQMKKQKCKKETSISINNEQKKIIKTEQYYQIEREKWKDSIERSNGSIKREERVNYFQNQMLRLQNDYSDSAESSLVNSFDLENVKEQQEIQNLKLRKKLEIFRNHLPQISHQTDSHNQKLIKNPKDNTFKPQTQTNRIDIASIIRKKSQSQQKIEQIPNPSKQPQPQPKQNAIHPQLSRIHTVQLLQFDIHEQMIQKQNTNSQQSLMDTHRQWMPLLQLQQKQNTIWKSRLRQTLNKKDEEINNMLFQQMILQALIEISQSQKLISFIKSIYEQNKNNKQKKAEGILTNNASIRDYINFFINFLYQYQIDKKILKALSRPLGPTPRDILKYFRGQEIEQDRQSEYVMSITIFNSHWDYSSELIYFDKKYDDEKKEAERVNYLKQLTKVFFRAIFDCFNQSLQPQRIYGLRGKPYPWSQQKLNVQTPNLKKSLSLAFQRVLRYSLVFSGVHFADKHHNLDRFTMQEIQQSNMVKLLTIELKDDQSQWLFIEDQLTMVKLEVAQYVEQLLLQQMCKILSFGK